MNESQVVHIDFNKEQLLRLFDQLKSLTIPIAEELNRIEAQHAQLLKRIEAIEAPMEPEDA